MKKLISMMVALILILTAVTFVTSASATCSEMYVVSKNGKGVHVRAGPSKSAEILRTVDYGETVLVDCGSIQKCIEHATGRAADIVLGKPDPTMLFGIMDKHGLAPDELAMVGDRVYTDTLSAHNAGALGVLVLSGETTREAGETAPVPPDLIAENVQEFGQWLEQSRQ